MSVDPAQIIVTSLDRLSLAIILALALSALWLAPATTASEHRQRCKILLFVLMISAGCAVIDLLLRTAALADVAATLAWEYIPRVLMHSDYGTLWLFRAALWIIMLTMTAWIWFKHWTTPASLGLLFCILATALLISSAGHAGEDGMLTRANLINWLHLISTSIWGGAVIVFATLILSGLGKTTETQPLAQASARLSTLATGALVVVLGSGIFNTWRQLTGIADLWNTGYGRVLLIKLLLVAVMLGIGALNRFYLVPKIQCEQSQSTHGGTSAMQNFLRILRIDSIVFITIVLVAVILGMQMPPVHS